MEAVSGATKRVNVEGKSQTVKIPAGVDNGSRIRFDDYDVLIEVRPDSKYRREGYDVITDEEIPFSQAALGTEITVDTVGGAVKLKIPSGTQPNTLIRLSGKGISHVRGTGRGDHYVRLKVTVPKGLSARQKEILREFEKEKGKRGWF